MTSDETTILTALQAGGVTAATSGTVISEFIVGNDVRIRTIERLDGQFLAQRVGGGSTRGVVAASAVAAVTALLASLNG